MEPSDDNDDKNDDNEEQQDDDDDDDDESKMLNKRLTREFFGIGIPAFVQLAAEPLASLVDTAYLGRLGPEVLGGAGVAISAQYAVSKLYNDPLLRTSISLVASQDGKARSGSEEDGSSDEQDSKDLSIAVSSAVLLALTVGLVQMVIYSVLTNGIIHRFGVNEISPMWHSAFSYLRIRALGTPAATLWLVVNGIFRGLGDTRTPLIYSLLFTLLNAILDPIFIFTLHFGASGAAAGTALAQYIALVPLLMALNRRVSIDIVGQLAELKNSLKQYLQAGGYVLFRTVGKVLAYSVCARQAVSFVSVVLILQLLSWCSSLIQFSEPYSSCRPRLDPWPWRRTTLRSSSALQRHKFAKQWQLPFKHLSRKFVSYPLSSLLAPYLLFIYTCLIMLCFIGERLRIPSLTRMLSAPRLFDI